MEIVREIVDGIRNFESLDDKMLSLKRRVDYLESREEDVRTELDYADSLSMRKRRKTVENWLTNVGGMKNQVQQLEQKVREGRFYNHLQLQTTLDKVTEEVKELIQLGAFPEGLTLVAHDSQGLPLPTTELVGRNFDAQKNLIQESIRNDNILCIGIYGMGGVGKTTLVKHVHNELLKHSNSSVFWVVASQNFSVHKLQNDIANAVQAEFEYDDDVCRRAAILAEALNRRKNSVLIIDDLWNDFPPESAGIVKGGGSKLVFTTRSLEVCHKMESQMQIRVETLCNEEASELFKKTLGAGTTLTPQIEDVAKSLVKECDGLPLGIITVAGSMRGVDDIREWNNALETLRQATRRQDDHMQFDKVFEVLRYSFDMLKNQTLQECFLYCSLYPEDYEIERDELIAKFIDEGLISRMRSRQAEFDRGHTILNKLEKVCILQGGTNTSKIRYVKMHDLVRDMALRIASESSRFLVVTGDNSIDEEKWSVDLERVSFYNSHIYNSASQPMCPRLSTLLLVDCRVTHGIPNSFFTHMDKLTVLDLSKTPIVNLPVSISNLKSLSALLLRGCGSLKRLCPFSDLRALKRLDLSYSGITELPEGMDLLTNLRDLSLAGTRSLQTIGEGILPKLSHLQHLKLPTLSRNAKVRGEDIASLRKLEIFQGKFYNVYELHVYISSWEESRPNEYRLSVGEKPLFEIRPSGIEKTLHIIECPDLVMLCQLDFLKKASDLRTCVIDNCHGMTHFFCTVCYNSPLVQRLEFLSLKRLGNLREVLSGERCSLAASAAVPALSTGAFSSLTMFSIDHCPKIKKLFTPAFLSHLQNLESLDVEFCAQLMEIVQVPDEDQDQEATSSTSIIFTTLPKLKTLRFLNLPELKSFCNTRKMVSDSLEEIDIRSCPKLERFPLFREDSHSPTSLQLITVNKVWWESIEFDLPNTKDILTPFVNF